MKRGITAQNEDQTSKDTDFSSKKVRSLSQLSAHHLMLNPHASFNIAWDETKQEKWCALTYLAISIGVKAMTSETFKSVDDLFLLMANFRAIIGTILEHRYSMGWFRTLRPWQTDIGKTYIKNVAQYQDCFPEIEAQFDHLLAAPSKSVTVTTKPSYKNTKEISLFGTTTGEGNRLYKRTVVKKEEQEFTFYHIACAEFDATLQMAREAYLSLRSQAELSKEAKRHLIHQILFSYAETMPLVGGNAAATQMMYHVLEKHYVNQYTYFDVAKSNHGLKRGYPFDIAAMLAIDFGEFEKYLINNILSSHHEIVEPSIGEITKSMGCSHITQETLLQKIEDLHQDTQLWYKILSLAYHEVSIPRQYNPFVICSEFEGAAYSLHALKTITKTLTDDDNRYFLTGFYEEIARIVAKLHKKVEALEEFKNTIDRCYRTVKAKEALQTLSDNPPAQKPTSQAEPSQPFVESSLPTVINPCQILPSFTASALKSALKLKSQETTHPPTSEALPHHNRMN